MLLQVRQQIFTVAFKEHGAKFTTSILNPFYLGTSQTVHLRFFSTKAVYYTETTLNNIEMAVFPALLDHCKWLWHLTKEHVDYEEN